MDYEKKYKEALERAREFQHDNCWVTSIFPELKESEDEKIKKRILLSLEKDLIATKNSGCNTKDLEECIAWLENQGQNPAWTEEDEEMFFGIIADIQFRQKTHNHEVIPDVYEREIDWLKSLKERVQPQWKPEDVHLEALRCVINGNNLDVVALKDLLEQLKKL